MLNSGNQLHLWTIAPGRYRLQIHSWPASTPGVARPWGAPIEVEVRSGETTLEHLGG